MFRMNSRGACRLLGVSVGGRGRGGGCTPYHGGIHQPQNWHSCKADIDLRSQWELVDDMIEAEGWKLVVLLRLSPIVPWNLLNIAMATTRIHFLSFFLASAIGGNPKPYTRFPTSVLEPEQVPHGRHVHFGSLGIRSLGVF